jgi:hypothetical protein
VYEVPLFGTRRQYLKGPLEDLPIGESVDVVLSSMMLKCWTVAQFEEVIEIMERMNATMSNTTVRWMKILLALLFELGIGGV